MVQSWLPVPRPLGHLGQAPGLLRALLSHLRHRGALQPDQEGRVQAGPHICRRKHCAGTELDMRRATRSCGNSRHGGGHGPAMPLDHGGRPGGCRRAALHRETGAQGLKCSGREDSNPGLAGCPASQYSGKTLKKRPCLQLMIGPHGPLTNVPLPGPGPASQAMGTEVSGPRGRGGVLPHRNLHQESV